MSSGPYTEAAYDKEYPPHPAADPPSLPVDTSACKEGAPESFGLVPPLSMLTLYLVLCGIVFFSV